MDKLPSPILYHYTSGDGLLGIVGSDSLRATKIHFMNDHQEFKHATDLARGHLNALREGRSGDTQAQVAVAVSEVIESCAQLNLFVACFSEDYDSLSQWRGYCPRSFGYNIGFDGDLLLEIAREQGFHLRRCLYDRDKQDKTVKNWAIETVNRLVAEMPNDVDPKTYTQENCSSSILKFVSFAPYLKDPRFKDEHEWRMVGHVPSNDPRIALRSGRSMLVPYIPVTLNSRTDQSPVWEIRVGPTPHPELAMDAMSQFFHQIKVKNGITRTMLPYRDW